MTIIFIARITLASSILLYYILLYYILLSVILDMNPNIIHCINSIFRMSLSLPLVFIKQSSTYNYYIIIYY